MNGCFRTRTRICGLAVVMLAVLAGCGDDPLEPSSRTHEGVDMELELHPRTVQPGDTMFAEVRLINRRNAAVGFTSECKDLSAVVTMYDGEDMVLRGANTTCLRFQRGFAIEPGDTLSATHRIIVTRPSKQPVPRGTWVLHAYFHTAQLPSLETTFEVE